MTMCLNNPPTIWELLLGSHYIGQNLLPKLEGAVTTIGQYIGLQLSFL